MDGDLKLQTFAFEYLVDICRANCKHAGAGLGEICQMGLRSLNLVQCNCGRWQLLTEDGDLKTEDFKVKYLDR